MPRLGTALIATALVLGPLSAQSADLVVWWFKGFYEQEDAAIREIIAAFEQESGKQVELVQPAMDEMFDQANAALMAGSPPDFLYSLISGQWTAKWAYDDRLADLEGFLRPALDLFDADAIEASTLLNGKTGRRGIYALPMGRGSNHVHVWNSLLEQSGFTLEDIPSEWEAFWAFWCDQVQPAVRRAVGRDDIWGVGLPMSVDSDIADQIFQFQLAYAAPSFNPDGRLQVDDPAVRARIIEALTDYTDVWRKGCTPPDSTTWMSAGNNEAFLAQRVVMTVNSTLSIPAALRTARPEDYDRNAVTIEWPHGADGGPLVIYGFISRAVVFKGGRSPALAGDFVRFLVEEGWLAHWLDFAGDRYLPPMRKLVEQPFWLDPQDPHRMGAAMQILTHPHQLHTGVPNKEWQSHRIWDENVWGNAVHRIVADGISPEQAVDEAIARIKHILAE